MSNPAIFPLRTPKRCTKCGADLTAYALQGSCPACMLERSIGNAGVEIDKAEPTGEKHTLPPSFPGYELLEEIARGGMGVVYKARQVNLNRFVALKVILSGNLASAAEITRFRTEAETAAQLQHLNIVAIHEVGEYEGHPFFTMDYVEGQTLAELVRDGPLSPREAAILVQRIAEAIHYAHGKGVLHRDLKPSNVILDRTGQPRITDFGLAKWLEAKSDLTRTGHVLGSPSFIPPEQARGDSHALGRWTDVYGLGALLYHLVTARPPFVAETLVQTLRLVAETEPVSPRLLNPSMARDLETICLKCLQKEPAGRYSSAQDLAQDLGRYLMDEPIHARPIRQGERFWRWCRRNPALASSVAAVILLILTVAIGSTLAAARLQAANRAGQEKLRDSYLAQARANRWSGQAGRRFQSLEVLAKAANIRPGLDLRNEAIACTTLADMRLSHEWQGNLLDSHLVSVDKEARLFARCDPDGDIVVRRFEDDGVVARFKLPATTVWLVRLSADGRWLAAEYAPQGRSSLEVLSVWSVDSQAKIWELPGGISHLALDFSSDGRFIAAADTRGSVVIYDLLEQRELHRFPRRAPPYCVRFSPDGLRLALGSRNDTSVEIHAIDTGLLTAILPHSEEVSNLEWHPRSNILATACQDLQVYLWDVVHTQRLAVLQGHADAPESLAFNHSGDLLASGGPYDGLYLWDPHAARLLVRLACSATSLQFSRNDRWIATTGEAPERAVVEVASPKERRVLHAKGQRIPMPIADFSRDGRILATTERDGVRLWDTLAAQQLAFLPLKAAHSVILHPNGQNLIATSDEGLYRWPIQLEASSNAIHLQLGSPSRFDGPQLQADVREPRQATLSPDGQSIAIACSFGIRFLRLDSAGFRPLPIRLQRYEPVNKYESVSFSADGKWVAAAASTGSDARIWSVESGHLVHVAGSNIVNVAFSPDGHSFVTCGFDEYRFWESGSWQLRRAIPRNRASRSLGPIVLDRSGILMAVPTAELGVQLLETASGRPLATLEEFGQFPVCFSPDGTELVTIAPTGTYYIWNLKVIRAELAEMGLDWDSTSYHPVPSTQAVRR